MPINKIYKPAENVQNGYYIFYNLKYLVHMKKIVLLFIFFVTTTNIYSQQLSKNELKTKLAESTCECANSKDLTNDNFELNLGLCIFDAISKYKTDVERLYGNDYMSKAESIGGEIGETMAVVCPDLLMKIGDNYENNYANSQDLLVSGIFKGVKKETFFMIQIQLENGSNQEFVLLDDFQNSYLIIDNLLKVNDKVKLKYYEANLFDYKRNIYDVYKILTDIKIE